MNCMTRFSGLLLCLLLVTSAAFGQGAATADLRGTITDPSGAVVQNAKVTIRDESRGFARETTTSASGEYFFPNLPTGSNYTLTIEAAQFQKTSREKVSLTVGQSVVLDVPLAIGEAVVVEVSPEDVPQLQLETASVERVISGRAIEYQPINTRDFIGHLTATQSIVNRDNGRPIGPAPTSGLNIGGQRGRSTVVLVDGIDHTDFSINAARSTLSQEAVREFQLIANSYPPEFGRASGGIVNVVSKDGTNTLHGNVFGFLRHSSFQANNAFAPVEDPPFTRVQYGATLGGPIVRNKTFFFAAFEQRRRQESGFFTTDVTRGLDGSATIPVIPSFNPVARTFTNITAAQATAINNMVSQGLTLLGMGQVAAAGQLLCGARTYAFFASSGGSTALSGANPLTSPNDGSVCPAISPILPGVIGPRFLLSGAPVPLTTNSAGQPIAFRPLLGLQTIFPISESTTFASVRFDHNISDRHRLAFRVGHNPSDVTGIQVESQNQALGQNDFSRTGIQTLRDWTGVASLSSNFTPALLNDVRFAWSQRRATFASQVGDAVAANISGTAFFGRELFSPVIRTETRWLVTDTVSWSKGSHYFRFGGDWSRIELDAIFELNFAGLFNFGGLPAATFGLPSTLPAFTPVQQYGLGFPSNFIQGFGNPKSGFSTQPVALFWQDTWKVKPNFTLVFGVRYDVEFTPDIPTVGLTDPLSGLALSAEDMAAAQAAMGVQQGFPQDNDNFAPRLAFSWDPWRDNKTLIKGAYGLFYDHPLQAVAFNSDIGDAVQQQQFVSIPGSPSPTALLNATQIFQGTVCVPGAPLTPVCAALPPGTFTPGVAPGTEYQFGRMRFNDQTFPGFGPVLPFSLPVRADFQYAMAQHASFSIEHEFSRDLAIGVGYLRVAAHHLPRPIDINAPDNSLNIANFVRFANRQPLSTTETALVGAFPTTGCSSGPGACTPGSTFTNAFTGETFTNIIPGIIVVGPRGRVILPAAANFFRPNAPNYFLVDAFTGLSPAVFDTFLAGTLRTPGVVTPFGSMNAQSSNGNSEYNALTVDVKKRFSRNHQFQLSYTWSHAIDDSSDLQTLLLPQDNGNLAAERADALFDQRHRLVFSAVIASPRAWTGSDSGVARFFADFTLSPILEVSSGRPFNILSNVDTNNDQSNQTDRPNVASDGTLTVPAPFTTGNLGRNRGITDGYASLDLRITRAIRFNERVRLDVIAEGFNMFNRFNQAGASPFFTDVNAFGEREGNRYKSIPTAAFDPRQFQFGLKLNW
jgi:hypothetical protein